MMSLKADGDGGPMGMILVGVRFEPVMESVPALARPLTFEWRSPYFSDTSFRCKSQTDIGRPPTKNMDKVLTTSCGLHPSFR
jgi:hypothetical protein